MDLLSHMATFVSIVDGKSLSAAARAQGLSLPAVSRQLRALEAELGGTLVVRSTRSLSVTEAGRAFYVQALRVLREVDVARSVMADAEKVSGRLVVSTSLTFGQLQIVPKLAVFNERHPHLQLHLRLEDRVVDLVGEGVDIAVRAGAEPPNSTAYVAQRLVEMRRLLVAAPAYLRKQGAVREPEQLLTRACLVQVTLSGTTIPWRLERLGRAQGGRLPETHVPESRVVEVRGALHSNAPLALRDLAVSGAGIAYLPDFVVQPELDAGALKRVLPAWGSPAVHAAAVYRAELRGSARVRAFLDMFS